MWKRKDLKKESRSALKSNYKATIIVCFIVALMGIEYGISLSGVSSYNSENETNVAVKNEISKSTKVEEEFEPKKGNIQEEATKGILVSLEKGVGNTKDELKNLLRAAEDFFIDHKKLEAIIPLVAFLIALFIRIFIKNILSVGERRFFLESRMYKDTRVKRLFYIYKERKMVNLAKIMFTMDIFLILWMFTIVGLFIKKYEYKMIPYILAENPDIDSKSAFKLSKELMYGHKFKAFILDISFWYWYALQFMTSGILGALFTNPYIRGAEAQLYMKLREYGKENVFEDIYLLNDAALEIHVEEEGKYDVYPSSVLYDEGKENTIEIYKRKYTLINLVLLFFIFAFAGWLWEVSIHLVKDGVFVNRGVMLGPWLPIYGFGGLIVLICLKKLIDRPVTCFFSTMVLCGIVEYATSYYLEMTKGIKWWDYSGYLYNLNGRICLEGLLFFAVGGMAFMYILAPRLDILLNKIPKHNRLLIGAALVSLFAADGLYSHYHPNTGKGITDYDK